MKSQQNFTQVQAALTLLPENTDLFFSRRFSRPAAPDLRIVRTENHLEFLRVSKQVAASESWAYAVLGACAVPAVIEAFLR
jgi:hypothetical protein